jgi:hypothetical protein
VERAYQRGLSSKLLKNIVIVRLRHKSSQNSSYFAELPINIDKGRWKEEATMVDPISGSTAFDFGAAAQATASPRETTTAPVASGKQPANVGPIADTVKLSPGAHVRLLKTQGQTVAEIAISTALSAQTVASYLGIAQAPLPTVAAGKK